MTELKDPLELIKEHMLARLYRIERDYKVRMELARNRTKYDFEKQIQISNEAFEYAIKYGHFSKGVTIGLGESGQYLVTSGSNVLTSGSNVLKWNNPFQNDAGIGYYSFGDECAFRVFLNRKPFIVHRWLMWVLFGVKWTNRN